VSNKDGASLKSSSSNLYDNDENSLFADEE